MTGLIAEYILATRPWSFTAAAVPILITAAVSKVSFLSEEFIRAMLMGITVQAGANLTNTYYDFVNGVDTKDCGEKTLVERKISTSGVIILSLISYIIAFYAILPYLHTTNYVLVYTFMCGITLSFCYTANPVGLKYKGLGDLTIFACFGPLLMQCTSLLLIGSTNDNLYLYSIPVGLLCEAILHANNARDIKADSRAGAHTLATMIGPKLSYLFYIALLAFSYIALLIIALLKNWGCVSALLTIPLAMALNKNYVNGKLTDLPEETAKLHLPFGILMLLGILFTKQGALSLISEYMLANSSFT